MPRDADTIRKSELAMIHVAKKDLGLDDDIYRDVLWAVARVRSSADLDYSGRKRLIEHFKSKGWKPRPGKRAKARTLASDDQAKKIRALWLDLHQEGHVQDPSEAALASFVKRMTRVDALQWLTEAQASRVIEHLKKWRLRVGVR